MKARRNFVFVIWALSLIIFSMLRVVEASSVCWSLQPSSITLCVLPRDKADVFLTLSNDPMSCADLTWTVMRFGGYYSPYMELNFNSPPCLKPGDCVACSVATVYVYSTTPYGTLCTCEGCTFEISVRDSVVEFKISGKLHDGTVFEGIETAKLIK